MPEMDSMALDAPAAPDPEAEAKRARVSKLEAQNAALRARAAMDLRNNNRHIHAEDYFRAYKMIKEGRLGDVLFEMEKVLDGCGCGWRGWV